MFTMITFHGEDYQGISKYIYYKENDYILQIKFLENIVLYDPGNLAYRFSWNLKENFRTF